MITDDAIRLIMVTGGAGIGKTTMVSRLLKGIERGQLPECVGELKVDGIVYLRANAVGSLQISAANIFAGLCKLLPEKKMVQSMEALWRDSGVSIEDKMQGLFGEFCHGWIVMLLDNFESMLDPANQQQMFRIKELVLDQTLRTLLDATNHKIKVILTTQIIPDALILKYSGKVGFIELAGLPSPYAENLLRQMDMENQIGLQLATSELLYEARTWTEGHPRTLENLYAILSSDRSETLSRLVHNPLKIREYQVHALLSGEAFVLQDLYTQSILKALAVYGHPMSSALVDELIHPYFPELDSGPVLRRLIKMRLIQIDAGRLGRQIMDSSARITQHLTHR